MCGSLEESLKQIQTHKTHTPQRNTHTPQTAHLLTGTHTVQAHTTATAHAHLTTTRAACTHILQHNVHTHKNNPPPTAPVWKRTMVKYVFVHCFIYSCNYIISTCAPDVNMFCSQCCRPSACSSFMTTFYPRVPGACPS